MHEFNMKNTIKYLLKDKVQLPKMSRIEIALALLGISFTGSLILSLLIGG
jgi:hypothetical protein